MNDMEIVKNDSGSWSVYTFGPVTGLPFLLGVFPTRREAREYVKTMKGES